MWISVFLASLAWRKDEDSHSKHKNSRIVFVTFRVSCGHRIRMRRYGSAAMCTLCFKSTAHHSGPEEECNSLDYPDCRPVLGRRCRQPCKRVSRCMLRAVERSDSRRIAVAFFANDLRWCLLHQLRGGNRVKKNIVPMLMKDIARPIMEYRRVETEDELPLRSDSTACNSSRMQDGWKSTGAVRIRCAA
jgi:hypothetical protein